MDTSHYLDDEQRAALAEQAENYGLACGWSRARRTDWSAYYVTVCEWGMRRLDEVAAMYLVAREINADGSPRFPR